MNIISIRKHPAYAGEGIKYLQKQWANEASEMVYEDSVLTSLHADAVLPQWYLLCYHNTIIGCAGLITNDFISRMDLYPWLCALYIEPDYRGCGYGGLFIERAKKDAKDNGFSHLYLCTDLTGYYEKYGFSYLAKGYHPWGESSKIYQAAL